MENVEFDRKDLKIEALRQRIAQITTEHEDRAADYRVEITALSQEVEALKKRLEEAEGEDASEEVKSPG